jgi:hypothetical protein
MLDKIISAFDEGFERTKRDSLPLTKEEWQTLKTAVLAQQTNNSASASCEMCEYHDKDADMWPCEDCCRCGNDHFTQRT